MFLLRTHPWPFWNITQWSAVSSSSHTWSDATSCSLMTLVTVKFYGDILVVSGIAIPACFTGRQVTPAPGFHPQPSVRGLEGSNPIARPPLSRTNLQFLGLLTAKIRTSTRVTSAYQHMLSAVSIKPPPTVSAPTLTTPPPSLPTTLPPLPCYHWIFQGNVFEWPLSTPSHGIRPPLWKFSVGLQTRFS